VENRKLITLFNAEEVPQDKLPVVVIVASKSGPIVVSIVADENERGEVSAQDLAFGGEWLTRIVSMGTNASE
jgi:hypothetical protein